MPVASRALPDGARQRDRELPVRLVEVVPRCLDQERRRVLAGGDRDSSSRPVYAGATRCLRRHFTSSAAAASEQRDYEGSRAALHRGGIVRPTLSAAPPRRSPARRPRRGRRPQARQRRAGAHSHPSFQATPKHVQRVYHDYRSKKRFGRKPTRAARTPHVVRGRCRYCRVEATFVSSTRRSKGTKGSGDTGAFRMSESPCSDEKTAVRTWRPFRSPRGDSVGGKGESDYWRRAFRRRLLGDSRVRARVGPAGSSRSPRRRRRPRRRTRTRRTRRRHRRPRPPRRPSPSRRPRSRRRHRPPPPQPAADPSPSRPPRPPTAKPPRASRRPTTRPSPPSSRPQRRSRRRGTTPTPAAPRRRRRTPSSSSRRRHQHPHPRPQPRPQLPPRRPRLPRPHLTVVVLVQNTPAAPDTAAAKTEAVLAAAAVVSFRPRPAAGPISLLPETATAAKAARKAPAVPAAARKPLPRQQTCARPAGRMPMLGAVQAGAGSRRRAGHDHLHPEPPGGAGRDRPWRATTGDHQPRRSTASAGLEGRQEAARSPRSGRSSRSATPVRG